MEITRLTSISRDPIVKPKEESDLKNAGAIQALKNDERAQQHATAEEESISLHAQQEPLQLLLRCVLTRVTDALHTQGLPRTAPNIAAQYGLTPEGAAVRIAGFIVNAYAVRHAAQSQESLDDFLALAFSVVDAGHQEAQALLQHLGADDVAIASLFARVRDLTRLRVNEWRANLPTP